jgi:transposase, IS30 family
MHYHLTQTNRIELSLLRRLGYSVRQVAVQLGVAASTVSRELRRNARPTGQYYPNSAKVFVRRRRARANGLRAKLLCLPQLAAVVEQRLKANWSPEQIAGWLKASQRTVRVCAQTIYDWVYRFRHDLLEHLHCRKGTYRRTRANSLRKAFRDKQKESRRITARPSHVLKRNRYGHWEGDSVVGKAQSGSIATFVERKSGYLMAALLPDKTATSFATAAKQCFAAVPLNYKRTLTLDNGSEMSNYEEMERSTSLRLYFARPYRSWERGTNENTNGLLRFYFPKQMGFAHLTQKQLDAVVHEINTRPRKRLGYRTPEQVFRTRW